MGDSEILRSWIDGAAISSVADYYRPLTGALGVSIARQPEGNEADADTAVCAARRAFIDVWEGMTPSGRHQILSRFAALILANAVALDRLDAADMGKPISLALFNATAAAGLLSYYTQTAQAITGSVLMSDRGSYVTQRWAPRGVVAAIVPWNFPTFVSVLKLAPALAAGNTVVLKPSELSPRSALRLAELGTEAGLPPGVLNVVLGLGETVGRALALHDDVDMLTFTGSTPVGKLIQQYAGQSNMKTVIAECGGKSPQIVFDDGVDLDAAADAIAGLLVSNQGQVCSLGSRLLVQRSIECQLVRRIVDRVRQVVIGDPLDPAVTFGPLASATQRDRVMGFIEGAIADGAELVTGGRRTMEASGPYVEPTIFRAVDPSSRLAQDEVFGPVLAIIAFDTEDDAIRLANGTRFGLAAYVWTADFARAMRMRALFSSVWIYSGAPIGDGAGHATSIEPYGQSGIGTEGGKAGLESYMRRQTLSFHYS